MSSQSVIITKTKQPIFVVGYMHSGTTLMRHLLGGHSAIYCGPRETNFFERFQLIRAQFGNLEDADTLAEYLRFTVELICGDANRIIWSRPTIEQLLADSGEVREHGALFFSVFDTLAAMDNKLVWLEKTPTHVFHIDRLLTYRTNTRVVHIMRDVRDVIASKKTRRATVNSDRYAEDVRAFKNLEKAYDPFWDTLSWKSAIRAGQASAAAQPDRVLSIRYEDLTFDPTHTMQRVCEFLALPYEAQMLDVSFRNAAEWQQHSEAKITTQSVGRWRQILTPAEVNLCQRLAHTELAELNHAIEPISLGSQIASIGLLGRSSIEVLRRLYRRWRMGGTRFAWNVLRGYVHRLKKLS